MYHSGIKYKSKKRGKKDEIPEESESASLSSTL